LGLMGVDKERASTTVAEKSIQLLALSLTSRKDSSSL